jgi:hypothetical protein
MATIAGAIGITVAVLSIAISTCCIDPAASGPGVALFRRASRYLWPTASIMPGFLTGPLDRQAVLLRVILAILANSIPYAVIGAGYVMARNALTKPTR